MTTATIGTGEARQVLARFFGGRGEVIAAYRLPDAHRHPSAGPPPVDLAVLFHPLVDQGRYDEFRLVIAEGLAVELNRPDVRVVVLNDASPHLAYDVLRRSDALYAGPDDLVAEFGARVQTDFLRSVHDSIR